MKIKNPFFKKNKNIFLSDIVNVLKIKKLNEKNKQNFQKKLMN